jgi:hypothetical protein
MPLLQTAQSSCRHDGDVTALSHLGQIATHSLKPKLQMGLIL